MSPSISARCFSIAALSQWAYRSGETSTSHRIPSFRVGVLW